MGNPGSKVRKVLKRLRMMLVVVSRQDLLQFDFGRDIIKALPKKEGVSTQAITPDALPEFGVWPGIKQQRLFRTFLNQGQSGIYSRLEGQLVYCHWCKVKRKPFAISCAQDPIAPGTAFLHRGNAKEGYRNLGLSTIAVHQHLEEFRATPGVVRMAVAVEPTNGASQKLFAKCGFRKVGEFTLIVVLVVFHIHFLRALGEDGVRGPRRIRLSLKCPLLLWSPLLFRWGWYRNLMMRLG